RSRRRLSAPHLLRARAGLGHHRDLHSFPTRRSSDLAMLAVMAGLGSGGGGSAAAPTLPTANDGSGTVLGDPTTPSESLSRSLDRSEEHTSELQSRENLVCRLLLEKKNQKQHQDCHDH